MKKRWEYSIGEITFLAKIAYSTIQIRVISSSGLLVPYTVRMSVCRGPFAQGIYSTQNLFSVRMSVRPLHEIARSLYITVVTIPFLTASLLGNSSATWLEWSTVTQEFWVRILAGEPKTFSPWNYFTGCSGNSVAPESASGSGSGIP